MIPTLGLMKRSTLLVGLLLGAVIFAVARGSFMDLLTALGYVDGKPGSLLITVLFLACMLVMCLGYGVGMAAWWAKRRTRPG